MPQGSALRGCALSHRRLATFLSHAVDTRTTTLRSLSTQAVVAEIGTSHEISVGEFKDFIGENNDKALGPVLSMLVQMGRLGILDNRSYANESVTDQIHRRALAS